MSIRTMIAKTGTGAVHGVTTDKRSRRRSLCGKRAQSWDFADSDTMTCRDCLTAVAA